MSIVWTFSSFASLRDIHAETRALDEARAGIIVQHVLRQVEAIPNNEQLHRPGRVLDTREHFLADLPLTISYRVEADIIQIVAILQGSGSVQSSLEAISGEF